MIPQLKPKKKRNHKEVLQRPKKFPMVSRTIGTDRNKNVLVFGSADAENPLIIG
jgi:hypothetical protein